MLYDYTYHIVNNQYTHVSKEMDEMYITALINVNDDSLVNYGEYKGYDKAIIAKNTMTKIMDSTKYYAIVMTVEYFNKTFSLEEKMGKKAEKVY